MILSPEHVMHMEAELPDGILDVSLHPEALIC